MRRGSFTVLIFAIGVLFTITAMGPIVGWVAALRSPQYVIDDNKVRLQEQLQKQAFSRDIFSEPLSVRNEPPDMAPCQFELYEFLEKKYGEAPNFLWDISKGVETSTTLADL